MIQAIFAGIALTAILAIFFALPVVTLPADMTAFIQSVGVAFGWADQFMDIDTLLVLLSAIFAFEVLRALTKFTIWGIRLATKS